MKKKIFLGIGAVVLIFVAYSTYQFFFGTPKSPPTTTTHNAQGLDISVAYSQPSKKGRVIFGEEAAGALQPYGKYWRLGANQPTEITFSKDVSFAGQPVSAGTYRMYTVPGPSTFKVFLNTEIGNFFGFSEPDHELDILSVEVPVQSAQTETEMFVIKFSNDSTVINMDFVWDNIIVRTPITVQ